MNASHRVTRRGDQVTIHDLELFIGYDPEFDEKKNKRIKKYDRKGIRHVVERTQQFIRRGQSPKLILGHNPKSSDKADGADARPTIGNIPDIRMRNIRGVPGIVGDVVMSTRDFEKHVKSNAFPRRSAEIWPDGFMSEVALLGTITPARPIPDTRFSRLAGEHGGTAVDRFERGFHFPATQYDASMSEPGAYNVAPPEGPRKKRRKNMAADKYMEDDDHKDDDADEREGDEDKDEMSAMRSKFEAKCDEVDELKSRLAKYMDDDEDKERSSRSVEMERDDFERQLGEQSSRVARLEKNLRAEKYGRKIDDLVANGYKVGDRGQQAAILDRVIAAPNPDRELNFLKDMMGRDPIDQQIDMRHARTGGGNRQKAEREAQAADTARDKCLAEDKPENFDRYYEAALAEA